LFNEELALSDLLLNIVGGGTPSKANQEFYKGTIPWVTVKDLKSQRIYEAQDHITEDAVRQSSTSLIPKGNVVIATRMALGKAFINEVDIAINQDLKALIADPSKVDTTYLLYSLLKNSEKIQHMGTGTTVKGIRLDQLKKLKFFVPPLKEQQKIAEILSSVDEAIEKTEAIIKQTETVKKGLMQQLLTKGIGHTEFKQTEIGEVPVSWEVLNFNEACDIVNGQVDPTIEPYRSMPNIGSANIAKFTGQLLEYQTADMDKVTSGKYLFGSEHVLFSKIRPELAKVTHPGFEGLCSADIYPVKAKDNRMLPEFIKYVLLDQRFYKYSVSVSGRTGMPKVNRRELDNYKVLCPSLEEQKKIVSCISAIEAKETTERKKLICMSSLKKSLMQMLLTGKVRVNVDQHEVLA